MKNILKLLVPLAIVVIIGVLSWWGYKSFYQDQTEISFKTEAVSKEDLTSSISASGTVEPEELINVGAQVSGKIMHFGTDVNGNPIDYGSYVKAGTLLAQIDDVLYKAALSEAEAKKLQAEAAIASAEAAIASAQAAVNSAEAAIASADASIAAAEASVRQSDARLKLATRNFERAGSLQRAHAVAESEYDSAEAEYSSAQAEYADSQAALLRANAEKTRAQADLGSSRAALLRANADHKHSQAQLTICEAELIKARRNLDYCRITAPVDGIIIDRRVSVGQTVVSNMSASSIFLMAKDLKKMEVWVSVNEADIGHIRVDMPVEFTIDTFPGELFHGVVKRIRLNATMSQNVVTYIVEVTTDNSNGKLIPYLTANVKFIRERRHEVLTVSNAAFRFQPDIALIAPEYRDQSFEEGAKVIYVLENNALKPVEVRTGLSAGGRVELIDPPLNEGDLIVYGAAEITPGDAAASDGQKSSPFMPKPEKRGVSGGGSAANRARAQGK
ncbi:MAG: efflux RND transporter periplasmic adaptor subunit [Lentisphaeria bacterium]|nr:efflux RND transporter periplasmic adaptor subunit [Lentisphaeria bacterium]